MKLRNPFKKKQKEELVCIGWISGGREAWMVPKSSLTDEELKKLGYT
jgi:hypothetical protein